MSIARPEEAASGALEVLRASPRSAVPPNDLRVLELGAELVEFGWCQRALAEDRTGRQVEPWSEDACSWSPLGALLLAWCELGASRDDFLSAYTALALATGGRVEEWNAARWRTARHVRNAFLRAGEHLAAARRRARGRSAGLPGGSA